MKKKGFQFFIFLFFGINGPLLLSAQYDFDRPSRIIRAEDGLPNHYFRGLTIDGDGFVWIGSYDGLSRFDGQKIQNFFHIPDDSTSIAHSGVLDITTNPKDGKVWIGTYGGLSVYNAKTNQFCSYYHQSSDTTSLPNNFTNWVYADRQGVVWVSSRSDILCRYNPSKDAFTRFYPRPILEEQRGEESRNKERIITIEQDIYNDSILWIGTNLRFISFNKYKYRFNYNHPILKNLRQVSSVAKDQIFLCGNGGEVLLYNPIQNKILQTLDMQSDWRVKKILKKSERELWLSCNKGVAILDLDNLAIKYPWVNDVTKGKKYDLDLIDQQGRLWGASVAGIQVFDSLNTQFKTLSLKRFGEIALISRKV